MINCFSTFYVHISADGSIVLTILYFNVTKTLRFTCPRSNAINWAQQKTLVFRENREGTEGRQEVTPICLHHGTPFLSYVSFAPQKCWRVLS